MLGSIVHNEKVVDDLEKSGAKIVDALDDVPKNSPILFRAHGTVNKLWKEAKINKKGNNYIKVLPIKIRTTCERANIIRLI